MRRHELSEAQWKRIAPLLPSNLHHPGQAWMDHRRVLNGMFWRLSTGVSWRDIPERYGHWNSIYQRFHRWSESGLLEQIALALLVELDATEQLDWSLWCMDGSLIRASRAAAGARRNKKNPHEPEDHALGRSRGGFGTKLHLVCEGKGVPLAFFITPGQRHENPYALALLQKVCSQWPEKHPDNVAGDKGYHSRKTRKWLAQQRIGNVIASPKYGNLKRRRFKKTVYKRRNVIERCIGWLKENRSLATRADKLALSFTGIIYLAFIWRYLKLLEHRGLVNRA